MQATVLLIDGESPGGATEALRSLIERSIDGARWQVLLSPDIETAQTYFGKAGSKRTPDIIVLNVDVRGAWPFCTHLKKTHPSIPVLVVSRRLGTEVFHNHQKLDSRADAYHRLPEEEQALSISLNYFSSHESEVGRAAANALKSRPRKAGGEAVLDQFEQTVATQARALEDARRQIEALEAERDAVAEQYRRQMRDFGVASGSDEVMRLRQRVGALEAELARRVDGGMQDPFDSRSTAEKAALEAQLASERAQSEARATALASAEAEKSQLQKRLEALESKGKSPLQALQDPDTLAALDAARADARLEAAEAREQLAVVSVQLASLTSELKLAHERRLDAEARAREATQAQGSARDDREIAVLRSENDRLAQSADVAERAYSAASHRTSVLESEVAALRAEITRASEEKQSIEEALQTSRRLMREYATDASRKASEIERLETRIAAAEGESQRSARATELEKELDSVRDRNRALEQELGEVRERLTEHEHSALVPELEAEIADLGIQLSASDEKLKEVASRLEALTSAHTEAVRRFETERAEFEGVLSAERERLEARWAHEREGLETRIAELRAQGEVAVSEERERLLAMQAILQSELAAAQTVARDALVAAHARELEQEAAKYGAERERLEAVLAELRERSGAEHVRLEAEVALANQRAETAERMRAERSVALADLKGEQETLKAQHAELSLKYKALEERLAIAEASHAADVSVIESRRRELKEALAKRDATEGYLVLVSERFRTVASYAKRLEARLGTVETARMSTEMQLESLLERVRGARAEGEVPPALELPER